MYHYVLFRLAAGHSVPEVKALYDELFPTILSEIPEMSEVTFLTNCVVRDQNMDAMIRARFQTKEDLQRYLTHPKHLEFAARTKELLVNRVSFDHE